MITNLRKRALVKGGGNPLQFYTLNKSRTGPNKRGETKVRGALAQLMICAC